MGRQTIRLACSFDGCREVGWTDVETARERDDAYGKFWHDGTRKAGGFVHGPGFKAWAEDHPVGTRLTITASLDVPQYAALDADQNSDGSGADG